MITGDNSVEDLMKQYEFTRIHCENMLLSIEKEHKRRSRALIKSYTVITIVSVIVACTNTALDLPLIVSAIVGIISGAISMSICIKIFKL